MIITFREAQILGVWDKISKASGINPWAVNEGQLDPDEPINITIKEKEKESHDKKENE